MSESGHVSAPAHKIADFKRGRSSRPADSAEEGHPGHEIIADVDKAVVYILWQPGDVACNHRVRFSVNFQCGAARYDKIGFVAVVRRLMIGTPRGEDQDLCARFVQYALIWLTIGPFVPS